MYIKYRDNKELPNQKLKYSLFYNMSITSHSG